MDYMLQFLIPVGISVAGIIVLKVFFTLWRVKEKQLILKNSQAQPLRPKPLSEA